MRDTGQTRHGRGGAGALSIGCVVIGAAWCMIAGHPQPATAQSVYVEDSPAAMELADRALRWRDQGRLSDAVAALLGLGETYGGKLMPVDDGLYVDAAWWVRRELASDEQLRQVYERQAEPAAARALAAVMERALHGGAGADGTDWYDADALAEVGRRYWLTPSGLAANLAWAAVMLERGEPAAARSVLDQLADHPLAATARPRLAELDVAAASLQAALAQRLADASQEPTDGDPADTPVALSGSLWTVWWNDLLDTTARAAGGASLGGQVFPGQRNAGLPGMTGWGVQPVPTLTADHVWVTDGLRAACLDRASGRLRWAFVWPGLAAGPLQAGQNLPDRRGVRVGGERAWVVLGPGRVSSPRGRRGMPTAEAEQGLWCLDAATGRALWSVEPAALDEGWTNAQFMGTPVLAGPGVVAVRVRRVQMSGFVDSFVAGLDAGTGQLRWKRHLGSTSNAGFNNTLPPAEPMVEADGRLLIDEGLGVAAALDPRDGAVWWLRKTLVAEADAAAAADGVVRPVVPGIPVVRGGRRAVMTSVQGQSGPVATDGGVLVAVITQPAAVDGMGMGGMGMGMGIEAWGRGAWLLDAATGRVLIERFPPDEPWVRRPSNRPTRPPVSDAHWASGAVWASDGRGGAVAHREGVVWRLDGRTLEPLWMVHPTTAGLNAAVYPPVVDGTDVIVAGDTRAVRIALDTGVAAAATDWPAGAAVAAGHGEAVTATPQAINGYVSVDQGQRRLRQRIAAAPDNPEPGLALATLGVRADRARLLSDGVTAALAAIGPRNDAADGAAAMDDDAVTALLESVAAGGSPTTSGTSPHGQSGSASAAGAAASARGVSVVLELIGLAASAERIPASTRRQVFERVEASVTGPDELVAFHLALGPLEQEARRYAAAAEHYQVVLREPQLAACVIEVDGNQRRAGLEARQQLTELVARVGFEVYEPFEQEAQRQLVALRADPQTTPEQLAALADRYPLAEASAQALLEAAGQLVAAQRQRAAVVPLGRAYRTARLPQTRAAAVGRLASLYELQGRPGTAVGWLQRVAREHPSLRPVRNGEPIETSLWIADLKTLADAANALPAFDPGPEPTPWVVNGQLMQVAADAEPSLRADLAVLREGARVLVYDPSTRKRVLRHTLPARDAVVLRFSDDQLVLFSSQRGELYALDLNPQDPAAPVTIDLDQLLETVGPAVASPALNAELRQFEQLLNQERINLNNAQRVAALQRAQNRQRFAVATDTAIVLADSTGRVIALDRLTLEPQWTYRNPAASTTALSADDETAVLVGVTAPGTDAQAGTIVAVDLLTGRPRGAPILEESNPPLDARPMPDGTLLITFPTFVASYTLDDTQLLWRTPRPFDIPTPFMPPPTTGDGVLAVTFPPASPAVLLLDPSTGQAHARLTVSRRANAPIEPTARLLAADARLHVLGEQPACYTDNGLLLWRSAIDDPHVLTIYHTLAADHVLVLTQHTPPDNPDTPRYRIDAYERDTGVLAAQHPLDLGTTGNVIAPLSHLYDHALAVSGATKTTFLVDAPE